MSSKLVSRLVNYYNKYPERFRDKKRKEKEIAQAHFALNDSVNDLMQSNVPITSCKIVQKKMNEKCGV